MGGKKCLFFSRFFGPYFRPKKRAQDGPFWPKWPPKWPAARPGKAAARLLCPNVPPIPPPGAGRRFGAGPVIIPESHFFTRVASGGLLLSKSGAEPGGGGETGLRRESVRSGLLLCIMFHFKTARACPLGQFPDP